MTPYLAVRAAADAQTTLEERVAVPYSATGPAPALRRAKQPLPAIHPIELVDASIQGVPAGQL
jgi:hypothetical protein